MTQREMMALATRIADDVQAGILAPLVMLADCTDAPASHPAYCPHVDVYDARTGLRVARLGSMAQYEAQLGRGLAVSLN